MKTAAAIGTIGNSLGFETELLNVIDECVMKGHILVTCKTEKRELDPPIIFQYSEMAMTLQAPGVMCPPASESWRSECANAGFLEPCERTAGQKHRCSQTAVGVFN